MIVCLVLGNHWRGKAIWSEVEVPKAPPASSKTKGYSIANQTEVPNLPTQDSLFALEIGESSFQKSHSQSHSRKASFAVKQEESLVPVNYSKKPPLHDLVIPNMDMKEPLPPMNAEEKLDNLNEFFEELFKSIDYSILIIFMGNYDYNVVFSQYFFIISYHLNFILFVK